MARFSHLYEVSWLLKSCCPEERTLARLAGLCGVSEARLGAVFRQPASAVFERKPAEDSFFEPSGMGRKTTGGRAGTPFWKAVESSLAGRYMEAAETLLAWMTTINTEDSAWMTESGLRFALGCLASAPLEPADSRRLSGYIGLCIQAQPVAMLYAVEPRLMRFVLLKGRKAAQWLMDNHRTGLMNILVELQSVCFPGEGRYGSLFKATEQGTGFAGLSGEYRPENALFFGAYHTALGHPRLALDHFLLLSREKAGDESFANVVYRPWEALALALTGDFGLAHSLLLHYLRKQRPWRNTVAVHFLQVHLVHVLLDVRDFDGALEHLDSLLAGVSLRGAMICWVSAYVALARYHAVCGRTGTAWRILRTTLEKAEAAECRYAPPLPFFQELLHMLHAAGYPDISGYEYETVLERNLSGPNLTLRHVALRLRAASMVEEGKLDAAAVSLKKCRIFFVVHGLSWEAAETIALLAVTYLRLRDRRTALRFVIEAWPAFNTHDGLRALWPQELVPLLPNSVVPAVRDRTVPLQRQLVKLLLDLDTGSSSFLQSLLGAFCCTLGASRAEFWKCTREGSCELLGNIGMDAVGLAGEDRMRVVREAEENIPFVFSLAPKNELEQSKGMGLLLPVTYSNDVWCCLYLEGENWLWSAEELTEALLVQMKEMAEIPIRRWLKETSAGSTGSAQFVVQDELISVSETMQAFLTKVDRVAAVDASVLLFGETGAGKELVARRIHRMSGRQGPFIAVNLSSIPEELFESEMLGYEKGAFTGANRQKKGILELVDGGTLFLDELPDISARFQVKLLRILQERNFMRLGGTQTIHSDFRLVAATNRNLKEEVRQGRFRADLYYRICVVMLAIPPLRERTEDILAIARYYLRLFAGRYHRAVPELSMEDCKRLCAHTWPGNLRELRNVMAQAAALSEPEHLYLVLGDAGWEEKPAGEAGKTSSSDNPPGEDGFAGRDETMAANRTSMDVLSVLEHIPTLEELESRYIQEILKLTGGRISGPKGAAMLLGINRTTLYKKMKHREADSE